MHRSKFVKILIPLLAFVLLNSIYVGFSWSSKPQIQTTTWDFPRLDTMYYVEAWPAATARTMALECKIDIFLGATTTSDVDALVTAGWTTTHSGGGLHYCYFGFNCRDVVPPWTTMYTEYHGRRPGDSLYPLNESSFRFALSYIIGCERTSWCWDLMKYIVVRNDFPMPPGFGEWRNPYILEFPEDWAYAEDILMENGFTVVKGTPTTDRTQWIWYCPNGMKLVGGKNSGSPGSARVVGTDGSRGIFVMAPPATVSIEFVSRHCKKWNSFFTGEVNNDGLADPLTLWHAENMASSGDMINIVWYQREHDVFYLCGSFSARNPDYLYDTFSSDQDIEGGNNDPGLVNAGLDKLLYAIKFFQMKDFDILAYNVGEDPEVYVYASTHFTVAQPSDILDVKIERCHKTGVYYEYLVPGVDYTLNPVTGDLHILKDITLLAGDALEVNYHTDTYVRIIYDVNFYRAVVWLADWKVFYLVPQMGNYGRDYWDLFKPGHDHWVNAAGYGAGAYNLPYTKGSIRVTGTDTGGSMKWQSSGDVVSLNPIKARWVYEVDILYPILETGMITRDNTTGTEVPWIGLKMEEYPWTSPEPGGDIPGMKMRFYIRNDVYWQDGLHVTTADIKWCYDYIAHVCPDIGTPFPEYVTLWSYYKGSTIINDYVIDIYVNTTGHWKTLDFAGSILTYPQIIWQGDRLDTYAEATAFKPWATNYVTWTGRTPTGSIPGTVLTCLIGTGGWYMVSWDESGLAQLNKNPGYWVRTVGAPDGVVGGLAVSVGTDPDLTATIWNGGDVVHDISYKLTDFWGTVPGCIGVVVGMGSMKGITLSFPNVRNCSTGYKLWIDVDGGPYRLVYTYPGVTTRPGDITNTYPPCTPPNGVIDIADIRCFVDAFLSQFPASGVPKPTCFWECDLTGAGYPPQTPPDGAIDINDIRCFVDAFLSQFGIAPPWNPY